jgi:hypothetical protein
MAGQGKIDKHPPMSSGGDAAVRVPSRQRSWWKRTWKKATAIGGALVAVGGAVSGAWAFFRTVDPPPCQTLTDVRWAGWDCTPAKAEMMVHGCDDTKSIDWLADQLRRLNDVGSLQLPFQPFKLVPSLPNGDGKIVNLWFCPLTDSDDDCRSRQTKHLPWHALWVGEDTKLGNAVKVTHSSAGFSDRAVYLDTGGKVWCEYQASKMSPIVLR